MRYLSRFLICVLIFGAALPAAAATFGSGEFFSLDDGVSIQDDVYAAGGSATIASDVSEDLVVAGGRVTVTGAIGADVLAAGGSINIYGDVADDVRVAGGEVVIGSEITGDLVVAGGSVHMLPGSSVSGEVLVTGGEVILEGDVQGDIRAWAGIVTVNGDVGGAITIESADRVTFGSNAVVNGTVQYSAPREATITEGAELRGDISFTETQTAQVNAGSIAPMLAALAGAFFLGKTLVLIVTALALFFLFRRFSTELSEHALTHFGSASAIGLAVLAAIPVLIVLLLVSIIGIGGGLLLGGLYLLALGVAHVYGGILTGATLSRFTRGEVQLTWLWVVAGVFVLEIVSLVPFVGWIIGILFFLAALGALARMAYERIWQQR